MKLRRLKSTYLIVFLSFVPYIVNTVGLLTTDKVADWEKYYIFVFNQYGILFPTVLFIFSGYAFFLEYKNRTFINWLSYPYSKFTLIVSKVLACVLFLLGISILNHL
ncbi:ABC transporter permease [Risungbinella massiliensis]|uniref:ABC transporter permease n=1 Tax=Risungbinella massiliensis TaxID=1329796 RepID=UPI00389ABEF8